MADVDESADAGGHVEVAGAQGHVRVDPPITEERCVEGVDPIGGMCLPLNAIAFHPARSAFRTQPRGTVATDVADEHGEPPVLQRHRLEEVTAQVESRFGRPIAGDGHVAVGGDRARAPVRARTLPATTSSR